MASRIKAAIRSISTTFLNSEGALTVTKASPDELHEFQVGFDNRQDEDAIGIFREHGDLEPLVELLLEANPALMRNYEARELIAKAARREPLRRTKKGTPNGATRKRNKDIWSAAFYLHDMGVPLSNHPDSRGKEPPASACRMIADRLFLSEKTIESIIRKEGGIDTKSREQTTEILAWKLAGEQVAPEWVLDHYFGRPKR